MDRAKEYYEIQKYEFRAEFRKSCVELVRELAYEMDKGGTPPLEDRQTYQGQFLQTGFRLVPEMLERLGNTVLPLRPTFEEIFNIRSELRFESFLRNPQYQAWIKKHPDLRNIPKMDSLIRQRVEEYDLALTIWADGFNLNVPWVLASIDNTLSSLKNPHIDEWFPIAISGWGVSPCSPKDSFFTHASPH